MTLSAAGSLWCLLLVEIHKESNFGAEVFRFKGPRYVDEQGCQQHTWLYVCMYGNTIVLYCQNVDAKTFFCIFLSFEEDGMTWDSLWLGSLLQGNNRLKIKVKRSD